MTEKVDATTTKLSPNPEYQGWESLGIPYSLPEVVRRCAGHISLLVKLSCYALWRRANSARI